MTTDYVKQQLLIMWQQLAAGDDVAPARVYRLEGYMQALVQQQLAGRDELLRLCDACYREVYGQPLPELLPPGDDDSLIPLPLLMARAPVK